MTTPVMGTLVVPTSFVDRETSVSVILVDSINFYRKKKKGGEVLPKHFTSLVFCETLTGLRVDTKVKY